MTQILELACIEMVRFNHILVIWQLELMWQNRICEMWEFLKSIKFRYFILNFFEVMLHVACKNVTKKSTNDILFHFLQKRKAKLEFKTYKMQKANYGKKEKSKIKNDTRKNLKNIIRVKCTVALLLWSRRRRMVLLWIMKKISNRTCDLCCQAMQFKIIIEYSFLSFNIVASFFWGKDFENVFF